MARTISQSIIDTPPLYVASTWRENLKIAGLGIVAGLLVMLLSVVLQRYIIVPLLCQSPQAVVCVNQGHFVRC